MKYYVIVKNTYGEQFESELVGMDAALELMLVEMCKAGETLMMAAIQPEEHTPMLPFDG